MRQRPPPARGSRLLSLNYYQQRATMSSDEESVGSNASEEEITDLSNR